MGHPDRAGALDSRPRGGGFAARWRDGITRDELALGLLCILFFVQAALMPAVDDTFWHLRAGSDIWRTHHVSLIDRYSHTARGLPWPDHEWLWQALAYGCYALAGMPLVTAGSAAFVAGTLWFVYRLMRGSAGVRFVLLALAVPVTSLVWVPRPHLVTLFCLVLLVTLLVQRRSTPVPLLFLLWANAHAGVSLGGLVLTAAFLAAAARWRLQRDDRDREFLRRLALILPLSALATCATPLGFGIFRFILDSTARLAAVDVSEWAPTVPSSTLGALFYAAVVALALLGCQRARQLVRLRRAGLVPKAAGEGGWAIWVLAAGALVLLPLAVRTQRNIAPFLLLATPLASHWLCAALRERSAHSAAVVARPVRGARLVLAGAALGALLFVGRAWAVAPEWLGWRPIHPAALTALRACPGPLYNHFDQGGALIWFAPDRPVFVDTRVDPYPLPFLLEVAAVERGQRSPHPLLQRWGIRCAFLPITSPTVAQLATEGWLSRFRDQYTVVLEAPPGS